MSTAIPSRPPSPAAATSRHRWAWAVAAVGAIVLLAAVGWSLRSRGAAVQPSGVEAVATDPTSPSADAVPVAVVRLAHGGIQRTSAQIGSVHPYYEADLYAKVSGYLAKMLVDYGDRVKEGQLLAEIDDPEVVKEAERAAADVAQAQAAVVQAQAFIESSKADREAAATAVEQVAAEVDRYKSRREYHAKKFARYRELVAKRAIPQQIADEEEEGYESARASEVASQKAVLNAKAQLNSASARVEKAKADLEEAKAYVKVAEAKREKADVLVGYTKITSPYNGVITKRNFFRGAFIRSAAEGAMVPLLTVAETDKVRVVTQVPDLAVPDLDVGDPAEVTLDALGSRVLHGKVSRFAESEDPTSRTMYTEIDLPNPDNKIRPGMYGIARIILDTPTKNATLPASSLVGESKGGRADVFVVRDGKAHKVRVEVGADDGLRVEILSGLKPDDEVIVNTGSVSEGTPVRVERRVASRAGPRTRD